MPDPAEETTIASFIPGRQKHYLASRLLLKQFHPDEKIVKDEFGKPHLAGSEGGISWSHSGNYAAFASCQHGPAGIDIETLGPRILKIENKFCNQKDKAVIHHTHHSNSLLLIWGAKESIYKWYGKKEVDFRLHMTCGAFDMQQEGRFSAWLHLPQLKQEFIMEYMIFNGHIAVWVVDTV